MYSWLIWENPLRNYKCINYDWLDSIFNSKLYLYENEAEILSLKYINFKQTLLSIL